MINEKKNFPIKNITIWVGAGVSINEPSRLPSGNELTEFAFTNMIIGKDRFLEIWGKINTYEAKYCNMSVTKFPRLELLLSSIAYIEKFFMGKGSLRGNFLSGLNSFDEVPFNENHMLLAVLAHAGARIMTANFDLGIERAYRVLYAEECTNIVHFHGTNQSGDKIGATIENVTHFVNKTIEHKIESSFYNKRSNYFFGYSFSDMYDINVTIQRLYSDSNTSYTKDNWVCNHKGWDVGLEKKVSNIFGKKDNVHIDNTETTEALKKLCAKYFIVIPNQMDKKGEKSANGKKWSELFLEKVEITEEFKILSSIHFYNRMGIAVDKIDKQILEKYEQMEFENDKREILEYHLAANSKYWYKKYGNSRLKTEYHKMALHKRQVSSKFEKDVQSGLSLYNVEQLIQKLKKRNFVMYEEFGELTKRMHKIKYDLVKAENDIDITDARYLVDKISEYPVGKFIEIILYASTYRYKMLLEGVDGKVNYESYKRASEIYYDIGNIDGIVSTQLDYLLSQNFKKDSNYWKMLFRKTMWEELKSLCKVTGTYRYEQLMSRFEIIKDEITNGDNCDVSDSIS